MIKKMKDNTEYQIFIGCHDPQHNAELVSPDELKDTVVRFFRQKEIGFSMYFGKGGYLCEDGRFVLEDTLCIDLIGAYDLDILKLARSLSMFMNQECSLVVKSSIGSEYR